MHYQNSNEKYWEKTDRTDLTQLFFLSFFLSFSTSLLSSLIPDNSFRLHPVCAQSWYMLIPVVARPCLGVNKRTSFLSSSLPYQECPACFSVIFEWSVRWNLSGRTVALLSCLGYMIFFETPHSILVEFSSNFWELSINLEAREINSSFHMMHYCWFLGLKLFSFQYIYIYIPSTCITTCIIRCFILYDL